MNKHQEKNFSGEKKKRPSQSRTDEKRGGQNRSTEKRDNKRSGKNRFDQVDQLNKQDEIETPETNEIAYGYHAVVEVLKQGKVNKLFLQADGKGQNFETVKALAQENLVPVKWVPKSKLDLLTDDGIHQGFVAGTTPYEYLTLDALLEKTENPNPFFVLLDELEDPHNLGSILRTADAAGVDGIILPKHRAVGVTGTVVKTSTGAVEYVPIARVVNVNMAVKKLKEAGFWIFGTDMEGTNFKEWNATGKIVLIIGNEGRGISAGLKKEVDEMLTIPMNGHVQSLNASVAAAILIYEAFMKRR
nr:23S rRNA (guanosine(2251)-2'-O)-methyltransferase RlmB [Enterococcus timonensis]